jgi:hypothetical protein
MKKFHLPLLPLHPILFAAYAVLGLLSVNLSQVKITVVWRPLGLAIGLALLLLIVLRLLLRSWLRSGLVSSLLLILFFSYGHLYDLLRQETLLGASFGHQYLLPMILLIGAAIAWFIHQLRDLHGPTLILNWVSAFLIALTLIQIVLVAVRPTPGKQLREQIANLHQKLRPPKDQPLPDIYVIVLDTYMRGDQLQVQFGYDNSAFLDSLREMGFYVAECGRSNYQHTYPSVAALLTYDKWENYIRLYKGLGYKSVAEDPSIIIQNNPVRAQLEKIGYKTVNLDSAFPWLVFEDAEKTFRNKSKSPINDFEWMLMETTALRIGITQFNWNLPTSTETVGWFEERYQSKMQFYTWAEEAIAVPGPKFVYLHNLGPHIPFVTDSNCNFLSDPNYYSGNKTKAANDEYRKAGYVASIECTNAKMLPLLRKILEQSDPEPIIIVIGDHGIYDEYSHETLNAYYLPGDGAKQLYPTLTPMNAFRIILNQYFGTRYNLLPDKSYDILLNPVPDPNPACESE